MRLIICALLTSIALFFVLPAQAHHSFIIYDANDYVTYKGVFTKDNFNAGSHASFEFEITMPNGEKVIWKAESQGTGAWPNNRMKLLEVADIGQEITVTGWPLRNGRPVLWLHQMSGEETGRSISVDNRIVRGASQFVFDESGLLPESADLLPEFTPDGRRTYTEEGLLTRHGVTLLEELTGKNLDERQTPQ